MLFGNCFEGDSGKSAAVGELGRGDVANNGLIPGYYKERKHKHNIHTQRFIDYLQLQNQLVYLEHQIHL